MTEGRRGRRFLHLVYVKCPYGKKGNPWTMRNRFQFRCPCGLVHDVVVK